MPEIWSPPLATPPRLLSWGLLGPLLLPAIASGVRFAASGADPSLGWLLLALFGPAIPVYLVILPLLPWALLALRRGRVFRLGPALLSIAILSASFDLAFHLSRP